MASDGDMFGIDEYSGARADFMGGVLSTPTKSPVPIGGRRLQASPEGCPGLRTPAKQIDISEVQSPNVCMVAEQMMAYVAEKGMISLAANQVGISANVFVFMVPDPISGIGSNYENFYAPGEVSRDWNIVINGKYICHPDAFLTKGREGSVSDMAPKELSRWSKIQAQWIDEKGVFHDEILEGLAATLFQNKVCYLAGLSAEAVDAATFSPPCNMEELTLMQDQLAASMTSMEECKAHELGFRAHLSPRNLSSELEGAELSGAAGNPDFPDFGLFN